ncbi:MAG TPA: hypothetical protein DCG71_01090 [Brevundimonas sp.]|nr:hypothetical protein [Brevundimonas sp.]
MANGGWYGTQEEWQRLEAPLLLADGIFERFAKDHSLSLTKNAKDWPERSLGWSSDATCLIQIYLANADALTWNLWLCCFQDRDNARFWRREFAFQNQQMDQFVVDLPKLLEAGLTTVKSWEAAPDQLEFAIKLEPLPRP